MLYTSMIKLSSEAKQAPEPLNGDPKERFEANNHIIKQLGSGSEATVSVYIPKHVAGPIYTEYTNGALTRNEACTKLRAALQAVKISKPTHAEDLRGEIEALGQLGGSNRPNIVKMLNADDKGNGWITIELLTGGDLGCFNASHAPDAFRWHVIQHLTEGFLQLHFGIVNGIYNPDIGRYVHHDISKKNLMFRYPGSFKDYPDLVIIDLGRARKLDHGRGDFSDQFKAQAQDVAAAAQAVRQIVQASSPAAKELGDALNRLLTYAANGTVADENERLKKTLLDLRKKSLKRREKLYRPLEQEIISQLTKKLVSDRDLLAISAKVLIPGYSGSSLVSAVCSKSSLPSPKKRGLSARHEFMLREKEKRRAKESSEGSS